MLDGASVMVAVLAALGVALPAWSAPPLTGRIGPIEAPKGPLKQTGPIRIDPALLDVQMNFDFRNAVYDPKTSGVSLTFPGKPTATAQGWRLTLFTYGIVWPVTGSKASAAHMVFSATNNPATADFVSNAFDLGQRRAVVLNWYGVFEPVDFPIVVRLSFGQDQTIGTVTFDKGNVLAGPAGQQVPIASYATLGPNGGPLHHLMIRADLAARTYTITFEQNGQTAVSPAIVWPAGTAPVPAGMQQVTARLTSPKPYVSGAYDLARVSLSGEPK